MSTADREPETASGAARVVNVWTRRSSHVRGAIILSLIGAVLIGLTWGVVNAEPANQKQATVVEPGQVSKEDGSPISVEETESYVTSFVVPGGVIGVSLRLGPTDGSRIAPPTGGTFLTATLDTPYDRAPLEVPREPSRGLNPAQLPTSKIWVRNGDLRAPLFDKIPVPDLSAGRDRTDDTRSAALPDADGRIVLELEFDGKRQRVDVRTGERALGAFASLYRQPTIEGSSDRNTAVEVRMGKTTGALRWISDAELAYRRVPYLDGHGWAKGGREWLVLDEASLRVSEVREPASDPDVPGFEGIPMTRTSTSKGTVTVTGARTVRAATSKLSDFPGPEAHEDEEPDNPRHAYYRAAYVVHDVPIGAQISVTIALQTSLAPPRAGAVQARETLTVPAVAREPGGEK